MSFRVRIHPSHSRWWSDQETQGHRERDGSESRTPLEESRHIGLAQEGEPLCSGPSGGVPTVFIHAKQMLRSKRPHRGWAAFLGTRTVRRGDCAFLPDPLRACELSRNAGEPSGPLIAEGKVGIGREHRSSREEPSSRPRGTSSHAVQDCGALADESRGERT